MTASLLVSVLTLLVASPRYCSSFAPPEYNPSSHSLLYATNNNDVKTISSRRSTNNHHFVNINSGRCSRIDVESIVERIGKATSATLLAITLSFISLSSPFSSDITTTVPAAYATDGAAIGLCLLNKCRLPLAKCILNPNCLANVICINTCNGKPDESGCQIECGNVFENTVVGEFNKCAVSDMTCVPQKADDGSYPIPSKDVLVQSFDTKLWNGRWYISAGQNKLFDTFPCQVHFFTETEPGKFAGKLNWRIEEPDGEFFTRDAVQEFVQDKANPAHLINHDNDYLHYQDDWYVVDYAADDNKDGVPPFAFVYYRGENDAWVGYGGAVVYTREAQLPEVLLPRLREAAKKVNFDFDKDFTLNDNTCKILQDGERVILREKFAGKMAIQTEKQLQQQAVLVRTATLQSLDMTEKTAEKAIQKIEEKAVLFEKELAMDGTFISL
jgi:violaxanthin de-epoxidase